jgi:LPXTG-site transpeptidase (sortase) family protein
MSYHPSSTVQPAGQITPLKRRRSRTDWLMDNLSRVFILVGIGLLGSGLGITLYREFVVARAERRFAQTARFEDSLARQPTGTPQADTARQMATAASSQRLPNSPPERLIIPAIGVDTAVVPVGWYEAELEGEKMNLWQTADSGAGFHISSAFPGAGGNTVISGHHNILGKVFARLHELKAGDDVRILARGQAFDYRVERTFIVQESGVSPAQRLENAKWISETPDERLTLITCWPAWTNTHRNIVVARRVDAGNSGSVGQPGLTGE